MPRRKLGRAEDKLSILGFGGIMLNNNTQEFANENIAKAFDNGINYYDVAPGYGTAQERMGPALKPYRDKCFLACKTTKRDKKGAEDELSQSLRKLETDHFDLYQMHALTTVDEVNRAFAPDGAMETFLKARQDGKIRHLGFSAHSEEAALRAMELFDFDTILFPLNFVCWNTGNFGPRVFEKAKQRNMGILALKSMALTTLKKGEGKVFPNCWYRPVLDDETLSMAFRYTLSMGVTAAVSPGESTLFWKGVDIARRFTPVTEDEREKLLALAKVTEPVFKAKMT
ncbi:MAG: aldo/keto reductase [Bacteroidetes bacterium]|nr:aldo/keto reductase [Bacteroidota bacterium]